MAIKVYIIAEIGINHEGEVENCARMIKAAAEVGADAVKLQTIDADANYVDGSESYKVFKGSDLTRQETADMFSLARECGLDVFTTLGDIATAEWVDKLQPSAWKLSSGLLNHIPLIQYLAPLGRRMLLSTGMANQNEIESAVQTVRASGNDNIGLFQCTSLYPAPTDSLNLATIQSLKEKYNCDVGFSDHSLGSDAAFLSIGAGATMLEKHFTLNCKRSGYDHQISLEPDEFGSMVERIRLAENMMGKSSKDISEQIADSRKRFLRTIVATKPIYKGSVFTRTNIGIKRPIPGEHGIEPKRFGELLGQTASRDIVMNAVVKEEDAES